MLAEENKNSGTSALEGKEVLPPAPDSICVAPSCVWQSLLIKRKKRGVLWDLKPKSLCHKNPSCFQRKGIESQR